MRGLLASRWKLLPWYLLALQGCGASSAPRALEGSLSVLLDLHYAHVQLESTAEGLAVRFVRPVGAGEDTVFKVSSAVDSPELGAPLSLDLAEAVPVTGAQRGTLAREVHDEPRFAFPPIERGRLTLAHLPGPGEKTSGELSVTFTRGTAFASGRTVFGTFEAQVQ